NRDIPSDYLVAIDLRHTPTSYLCLSRMSLLNLSLLRELLPESLCQKATKSSFHFN
ncbi:MAG: hypothetical protein ACI9QN_002387, partial [Arcticibacterium sp.]